MKRNLTNLILVFIGLVGMGLIAYPSFADWWNNFHQSRAVASYMEAVANMDKSKYESLLKEADDYNRALGRTGIQWTLTDKQKKEYNAVLNINDSGIMGYIDIPKINIELPIYHGTDEAVLQVAVGHIEGTSLPVGGRSTHCVVSGHRGLPSARLFTDIDKLVEGDTFTLTVLNRTVTYEVDQIRIVEPTDLSDLSIQKGKDLCTLVTCTPYGINTHRLLVRGHRVANAQGEAAVIADAMQIESIFIAPFIAVPILILLVIWMLIDTQRNKKLKALLMRTKDEYGVSDDDDEESLE
ncbi:MAG: class C sortase [Blautia sp.]|nr:class C sortase [Blautia sp.]